LITREVATFGINLGGMPQQQQQPQPQPQQPPRTPTSPSVIPDIPLSEPIYQSPPEIPPQPAPYEPEQLFQTPWADNFGGDSMNVDRGVFEAMSSFEPLSVRVGAIHESDNQGTFG
jgi:hypothetical protein